MVVRWLFEGFQGFFTLFLQSLLPGRPPCHPPLAFCLLPFPLNSPQSGNGIPFLISQCAISRPATALSATCHQIVNTPILSLVNKNAIAGEIVLAATSPLW
jgi:hypothetical protein